MAEEDGLSWYDDQPPTIRSPHFVEYGNLVPTIRKKKSTKMKAARDCKNCYVPFIGRGTKAYCTDCTPNDSTRLFRRRAVEKYGKDYYIKQLTNK